ncbi:MAG: hypothetical protein ACLUNV_06750 [Sutterella wadsworthensis]
MRSRSFSAPVSDFDGLLCAASVRMEGAARVLRREGSEATHVGVLFSTSRFRENEPQRIRPRWAKAPAAGSRHHRAHGGRRGAREKGLAKGLRLLQARRGALGTRARRRRRSAMRAAAVPLRRARGRFGP